MSVALFFITHEGIASNLITIGEAIIKKTNNNLSFFEVPMDADITLIIDAIEKRLTRLDTNEGVLFFTDMYGGTPSNVAQRLADKHHAHLISGVNLPMVIRLLNYRDESEKTLILKTLEGAKIGIQDNTPAS